MEFKVGDKVNWNGAIGEVKIIDPGFMNVEFEDTNDKIRLGFFPDGRCLAFQTKPCLKLVSRNVKKYKVLYKAPSGQIQVSNGFYKSKKDFDGFCENHTLVFMQLLESTMIEVEE